MHDLFSTSGGLPGRVGRRGRNASRQWERNLGNLRRRNTFRHSLIYCTITVLNGAI